MSTVEKQSSLRLEVHPPRHFTWPALFVFTAYGLLLFLPAVLSMLIVSAIPFGYVTFALPLLALVFAVALLPFGFGNTYAARLAARFEPGLPAGTDRFLVQVTFDPRFRSGLRSALEDADDIGWVYCAGSMLHFIGDSVRLEVPLDRILAVRRGNAGLRGLFLYSRIEIEIANQSGPARLWFAERSSCFLPATRSHSRRLFDFLQGCARR